MEELTSIVLLRRVAAMVKDIENDLQFTILEVGALDLHKEPFYELLDLFPGSKIIGFEADINDCERMNSQTNNCVHYYPVILAGDSSERNFYVTKHQMCCSLFEPNQKLNSLYNNLEVADLESITKVKTTTMDKFVLDNNLGPIDFIKIDVQGAELEIFKGGLEVIKDVLLIVSEVMFIPHYIDQPLFGDISKFLEKQGLMFHKFLSLCGRTLRPLVQNNDVNFPSQHIWSDAVFVRHVQNIVNFNDHQILKLSVLSCLYGSVDLACYCLLNYEKRKGINLNVGNLLN